MLEVDFAARAGTLRVSCRFLTEPGSTIALVGASGAGKTTVLRAVAGLVRPDVGRIVSFDTTWFDALRNMWLPPQRRSCTMVFASHALFGHMTALENVAFGLRAAGCARPEAIAQASEALELVGLLQVGGRTAAALSSGEAQRVALARALSPKPRVLLLDEPFSAVDVEQRAPLREMLQRRIRQEGMTGVMVTHEPVEAMLFSQKLIVMEAGSVVQAGSAADLRERPSTSYVAAFAGVNLFFGAATPMNDGTSRVTVNGETIIAAHRADGPVAVVLDPEAVVLSVERPHSSARNCFVGSVSAIVPEGPSLRVTIASTPKIVARVTRAAANELGLAPGTSLYATFKATELRLY